MGQYTSYYLYEKYETRGEQDPIPCYPNVYSVDADGTMQKVVRLENDPECGWSCDPIYEWRDMPIDSFYECDECNAEVLHKWELGDGYICEGTTKYERLILYYNKGTGWFEVNPIIEKPGNVIEEKSLACGYELPRFRGTLADGSIKEIEIITSGAHQTGSFDSDSMMAYGVPPSQVEKAEFFLSYSIKQDIFAGCQTLTSLTLNSNDNVESYAFFSSGLKEISGNFYLLGSRLGANGFQFANCKNLTSVTVTNETLHQAFNSFGTFANCTGLTQIDVSKLYGMFTQDYSGGGGNSMSGMFLGCTNLRTAKVAPDISSNRFEGCTSLESVDIYSGFITNDDLKIAKTRFEVGDRAFFNCSNLSSLTLSYHDASVQPSLQERQDIGLGRVVSGDPFIYSIGEFAFFNCEKLPVSEIEDKLGLELDIVWSDIESTTGTTSYSAGAFVNCKSFTHIPIPQWAAVRVTDPSMWDGYGHGMIKYIPVTECPVTSVGAYAFSGCTGLHELEFDRYIESIGAHAFDGCTGLTGITIDNLNPPTLGEGAFDNTSCNIYVPCDAVVLYKTTSIWESYADRIHKISDDCTTVKVKFVDDVGVAYDIVCNESSNLTYTDTSGTPLYRVYSIYVGDCTTWIGNNAFTESDGRRGKYSYVRGIHLPDTITEFPQHLFRDMHNLNTINIPNNLLLIGYRAFSSCSGLTNIVLPDSVTTIEGGAFEECYGLTSVTIGSGITSIGQWAFINCSGLTSITINATTPPTLGSYNVFDFTNNCPLLVPAASVEAYKEAWTQYASRIQPIT